jgi:tetratricopeptide (TPR) repeat protein
LRAPAAESQKLRRACPARRLTRQGAKDFERGNHPDALKSFEGAAKSRPADPAVKYNLADGLYKNGKFDEAEALYRALGGDVRSELAAPSRFNLGNTLYQKQDYQGAVSAYKDALRLRPGDEDTIRNLELALRQQKKQQEQQQRDQQKQDQKKDQQDQDRQQQQKQDQQKKPDARPERPKTEEEKEQERFQKEAGMPKERAMQLLDALQQNEKDEQKKLMAAKQPAKRPRRDW